MLTQLQTLLKALPNIMHSVKFVVCELMFFGWAMIEMYKFFSKAVLGGE